MLLVISDNIIIKKALTKILKMFGFECDSLKYSFEYFFSLINTEKKIIDRIIFVCLSKSLSKDNLLQFLRLYLISEIRSERNCKTPIVVSNKNFFINNNILDRFEFQNSTLKITKLFKSINYPKYKSKTENIPWDIYLACLVDLAHVMKNGDGLNKVKYTDNSIEFKKLLQILEKDFENINEVDTENKYTKLFKDTFDFYLKKRNDINSLQERWTNIYTEAYLKKEIFIKEFILN